MTKPTSDDLAAFAAAVEAGDSTTVWGGDGAGGDATEVFPDITQAAPDLGWSAAIPEPEPRARGILGAVGHKLRESRSAFAGRGQRRGEHVTDSEAESNTRGYVGTKVAGG